MLTQPKVEIFQGMTGRTEHHKTECLKSSRFFVESILRLPPTIAAGGWVGELQHLLFSATLSHDPEQLQHLTLYRPKLFTVTARDVKLQTNGSCKYIFLIITF